MARKPPDPKIGQATDRGEAAAKAKKKPDTRDVLEERVLEKEEAQADLVRAATESTKLDTSQRRWLVPLCAALFTFLVLIFIALIVLAIMGLLPSAAAALWTSGGAVSILGAILLAAVRRK